MPFESKLPTPQEVTSAYELLKKRYLANPALLLLLKQFGVASGLDISDARTETIKKPYPMTDEQKEWLKQEGYFVGIDLPYETMATIRAKMNISVSGMMQEAIEEQLSMVGQIAIRLNDPIYTATKKNLPWKDQVLLIQNHSNTLKHGLVAIPFPNEATAFNTALQLPNRLFTLHRTVIPTTRTGRDGIIVVSCTYEEPKLKGVIETGINPDMPMSFVGVMHLVVTEEFSAHISKLNSHKLT